MRLSLLLLLLVINCTIYADSIEELEQQGIQHYRQKQYGRVIHLLQRVVADAPERYRARYFLGRALVFTGKIEQGFEHLQSAAELHASYRSFWELGKLAEEYKKYQLASKSYKKCLQYRETLQLHSQLAHVLDLLGNFDEAWQHRIKRVAMELPQIRQLSFKHPVVAGVKNREQLKQFLLKEFDEELPVEKGEKLEKILITFGLIPPDLDLRTMYIRLLTEQIGGFYNPKTKRLYLISEPGQQQVWDTVFTTSENDLDDRVILAHEMTHAVQDQYFDLTSLQKKVSDNDDRSLALSSLIEGDATLAMIEYSIWPQRVGPEDAARMRLSFQLMSFLTPFSGGEEFSKAPRIIRDSLLFPYIEGLFFSLEVRGKSQDWQGVNQAFARLPQSTEHILHPQKYLRGDDPALDFVIEDLSAELGEGWRKIHSNVMGELGCKILLEEFAIANSKKVAQGWGGDRYIVYENNEGKLALIWLTVWDSPGDANEFLSEYRKLQARKYSKGTTKNYLTVSPEANKVFVLEGIPQQLSQKVLPILNNWRVVGHN